ncbi:MAG: lauroyl acyltransferase [Alphaproteobacteria bacterium]
MKYLKKFVLSPLEAIPIICIYMMLKALPVAVSSALMGKLARWVGPFLPVTRLGLKNLHAAFPDKTPAECKKIIKDVWENLGRTVGELPHSHTLAKNPKYIEVVHGERIEELKNDGKGGIFFSAHLANWELPHLVVNQHQLPIWLIWRAPNNWISTWFLKKVRESSLTTLVSKGSKGSKQMIKVLLENGHVGLLLDQRLSEGEKIPFFNRPALTVTGPAKLANKMGIPLVPVQVERLKGCHFRITFHPPLKLGKTPLETTEKITKTLEGWITKNPGQWLWLHNRWRG